MKMTDIDPVALTQIERLRPNCVHSIIGLKFRVLFSLVLFSSFILFLLHPETLGIVALYFSIINFFGLFCFRLFFLMPEKKSNKKVPDIPDPDLPTYTILVPLKEESAIVERLTNSLIEIDYPERLLQIIIIIEVDDYSTRSALEKCELPQYFEILQIPVMPPFTKGRAIQHGIIKATGEMLTVYDAEDRPDRLQLRKAVAKTINISSGVCYQGMVRIENSGYNWLTRLFAAEFFEWFEIYSKKLSDFGLPLSIAGQSYHIKKSLIDSVGGWDPFNVTEDAELSIRLIIKGVKLEMLDSTTFEIAPTNISVWIKQRIRWCKGLLVTQLVYLKNPLKNFKEMGFLNWTIFWARMFFGTALPLSSAFIAVFFLLIFLEIPGYNNIDSFHMSIIQLILMAQFLLSFMLSIYNTHRSLSALETPFKLANLVLSIPVYWIIYMYASFGAIIEFVIDPVKWHKTEKG